MIYTLPKGSQIRLAHNFMAWEFDCPCDQCQSTLIDSDLADRLQIARDDAKLPLAITSGYRCADYQDVLRQKGYETAAGKSTHEMGMAADIKAEGLSGEELEAFLRKAGFLAVGVGKNFCHADTRNGKERRWVYAK